MGWPAGTCASTTPCADAPRARRSLCSGVALRHYRRADGPARGHGESAGPSREAGTAPGDDPVSRGSRRLRLRYTRSCWVEDHRDLVSALWAAASGGQARRSAGRFCPPVPGMRGRGGRVYVLYLHALLVWGSDRLQPRSQSGDALGERVLSASAASPLSPGHLLRLEQTPVLLPL